MMAKYYIRSGPVRLILSADSEMDAAVKAFQWSCDRQSEIAANTPLERIQVAERRGWLLGDEMVVNETGFDNNRGRIFATVDVVAVWQGYAFAWDA